LWTASPRVCTRLLDADLQAAADRARLLPYLKDEPAPERTFDSFLAAIPVTQARIDLLASGRIPELEFDFDYKEMHL
jgi:hypothetical protein